MVAHSVSPFHPRKGIGVGFPCVGLVRGILRGAKKDLLGQRGPKRAVGTDLSGKTHRLTWADNSAAYYRMKCSCGWVDPQRRYKRASAVSVGNSHVREARNRH